MKRIISIIITLAITISCSQSSTKQTEAKNNGNTKNSVEQYLQPSTVKVQVYERIKDLMRQRELSAKLKQGIVSNYEWFKAYAKDFKKGEKIPYHTNFGLTEEEYNEFNTIDFKRLFSPTFKSNLDIISQNDLMSFKGEHELTAYNNLTVDLKTNDVKYKGYTLSLKHELTDEDIIFMVNNNELKYKFSGHQWVFNSADATNIHELAEKQTFTSIKFTLGKMDNGNVYMELVENSTQLGKKLEQIEVPLTF